MRILECWIEHPVRSIDRTFTYLCTEEVQPLCRVMVDFNHRRTIGFVESVQETDETPDEIARRLGYQVKMVSAVLDHEPLLSEELHDLAFAMKEMTLSPAISCFSCMLPGIIKPSLSSSEKRAVTERWVSVSDQETSLTPKQLEAWQYVQTAGRMPYHQLRRKYPNQARKLIELGALRIEERQRQSEEIDVQCRPGLQLTPAQQNAMDQILSHPDGVTLLRGATGSGKTEIYLHLAAKQLSCGRQVLILVPEISLTPQMVERVTSRFGNAAAIYHSGLNAQQKYEQYLKVRSGRAGIVVGTRSAVFLPFANLGLIVMDEEHDGSYKQDSMPAYHCRDIAIWRGKHHHCMVLLGSATPSLDSYARALRGVYHLVELDERINQTPASVSIIDMKQEIRKGGDGIISRPLQEKMAAVLAAKKRVILMLNRRGYSPQLRCRSCGEVILCPHCELAMAYHRDERLLKCHACGTVMKVPPRCPSCKAQDGFMTYGFGTEKLEEEVHRLFPDARTIRMDADTTSHKDAHQKLLAAFGRGEADILLGTQMIAKGLDYPDVTLVGVINGDAGMARSDFRSCESAFDLLMQAAGRSGRGEDAGEAVYQVFDPDHYAVQCAARQDYRSFFQHEMQFRHAGQYPPYTYLISLTVASANERQAMQDAVWLRDHLHGNYKTIGVISLLKLRDLFRCRVILKGKNLDEMRHDTAALLQSDGTGRINRIKVDVNPLVLE